jgi:hypothetical protein
MYSLPFQNNTYFGVGPSLSPQAEPSNTRSAFLPKLHRSLLWAAGRIRPASAVMGGLLMSIIPVIACAVVVTALASAQGVSAQNRPVELTRAGPGS